MVHQCVVGQCSNLANYSSDWSQAVSLHRFPDKTKKAQIYQAWVNFVCQRRYNWSPGSASMVCSKHFTDDCFENKQRYLLSVDDPAIRVK